MITHSCAIYPAFCSNLTAVVSSFKWKWFYVSLCPFIQAGWGLIPFFFFFSTYSVACKSFSIILLKMHKQTHRNKHKPIFEAVSLFLPSLLFPHLFFSPSLRKGLWLLEGQGVFYWQGNTLLLIILSFPSFHPFTEFLWVRLADTRSLISQTHSLIGPQESQFRPTNWPGWPFLHLQSRITDTQNDDTSPPMSPVTKIIRDYLSVLALPFLSLFSQSVKCSAAVHSSQMGQW